MFALEIIIGGKKKTAAEDLHSKKKDHIKHFH